MNTRRFLLITAILGATAVILGAFGAHILKKILAPEEVLIFETGVRYQFYHTLALGMVAITSRYLHKRWTSVAGWLFIAGIAFFSGSLYLLALLDAFELQSLRSILGPMTPLGGILFILGWLAFFRAAFDYKKTKSHSHGE